MGRCAAALLALGVLLADGSEASAVVGRYGG
eukprot:COSAG02_NODE_1975_length_10211_cov_8.737737_1_plen_30_part_10